MILTGLLALFAVCSIAYCALVVVAARRYLGVRPPKPSGAEPVSVLSPVAGLEDGLEENLRSFFEQRYSDFEILFAARGDGDPALDVARKLIAEYPRVPARAIATGEPPCPNAKVFSLERMIAEARHELLVMKDSDVRVEPDFLARIAAEFEDPGVGVSTCPYRAIPGRGFWWRLDAIGMNTRFFGGVLVARMLGGMDFALGPAIAARRATLDAIGGIGSFRDFLAEDFLIGKTAHERGCGVILSSRRVDHHFGGGDFRGNFDHRLRWVRSTRCSRGFAYAGELFTHPLPIALALVATNPRWWPLAALAALLRAVSAWASARQALDARLGALDWALLPLEDLAAFVFWVLGFFGRCITWRGRRYRLLRDGRIAPGE